MILRENLEQKHYIFTLSNRLSVAEFERGQIRESIRTAAEYRDNVTMQQDLRYENSVLKGQLEQVTSQRQIIAQIETKSLRPTDQTIWQEFQLIATELKDACSSVEITIPPASTDTGDTNMESREINSWTRRLAGCPFNTLLSLARDTDVSDFHIATALAAAAISDLVFASKFPDFLAHESPVLDHYRTHILTRSTSSLF
jgi:hypothetical protein